MAMTNETLEKPCIFITSLGRTGTKFFGNKASLMIEDCTSVHEPDLLYINQPHEWYWKIKKFGFLQMTFGKFMPRYSLRVLSVARQIGKLSDSQAALFLEQFHNKVLEQLNSRIYLEANWQYRGVIDLLPLVFPVSRIIYIIRDPRFWIRSWMNKPFSYYSRSDYISWFKNGRLTPFNTNDDFYNNKWNKMNQFEKLCWAWSRENSYALECASKTDFVKVFRFEDLFDEKTRDEYFPQMLQFITNFPNGYRAKWIYKPELVSQKIHATSGGKLPIWTEWSDEYIKLLDKHCRDLMERFNYGKELEWRKKINRIK